MLDDLLALMPKTTAGAVLACALALVWAPAHAADAATPNDTARFLAGMPPAPDSPLAGLSKNAFWEQHAGHFDRLFSREETGTLAKIRAFSKAELPDKHDTVLYTFSGPDFLYATTFFPTASTYVLVGLEPVGPVPQLTNLSRPAIDGSLRNLEISLNTLLSFSFFVTHKMRTELSTGALYGTTPILYVFLARTGKTLQEATLVSLGQDGTIHTADEPDYKKYSAARGARIVFSDGNGPKQTLYYFSTNLADGSVERSGFLAFCGKLGATDDSFIKSASYLLHSGGFTRVRRFILDHSATIVEDDSGIPLAYFDRKQWRLRPFGRYVGPLSIFSRYYQGQMTQLFYRANATPLNFGLGYRWRTNESNLLIAERVAPPSATGAEADTMDEASAKRAKRNEARLHNGKADARALPQRHRKPVETSQRGFFSCIFPFCSEN
jgi:hypothetical protein